MCDCEESALWKQMYEELRAAVLEEQRTRNPGCRDMPYRWALLEAKRAGYKLKALVGLIDPAKIPEQFRTEKK